MPMMYLINYEDINYLVLGIQDETYMTMNTSLPRSHDSPVISDDGTLQWFSSLAHRLERNL